jgi:hypothetical protein
MLAVLLTAAAVHAQPVKTGKSMQATGLKLKSMNLSSAKLADLVSGQFKGLAMTEKIAALANMPNRYGAPTSTGSRLKEGTAPNGLRYFISNGNITPPSTRNGSTSQQRAQDDLILCKTTPMQLAKQFAGPLFTGLNSNQNQSQIYPGALFRDVDVVQGIFTPQTPARKPGSIMINVLNTAGGVVQTVQDFNSPGSVASAVNTLLTGARNANANTAIDYQEFFVSAKEQINLDLEVSADVNLAPIIEVPIDVGVKEGASLQIANSMNVAAAALYQIYYTISLGDGPLATINGTPGDDLVCVTDVIYGRVAYLFVASASTRSEAQLQAAELLNLGTSDLSLAQVNNSISAGAKRSLEGGFVKIKMIGGNVENAVTVNNLQSLRNFIQQIKGTVSGVGAMPIMFNLRYAVNNAPAKVAAFADFIDRECVMANRLKVTLNSMTATKVVDLGDEELYGEIEVPTIGRKIVGDNKLWDKSASRAVQGKQGIAITIGESVEFNINPGLHPNVNAVRIEFRVKDRIMPLPDIESTGASEQARKDGFVKYTPSDASVSFGDISRAPGGKLNKSFVLSEGEARVSVSMTFELFAPGQ